MSLHELTVKPERGTATIRRVRDSLRGKAEPGTAEGAGDCGEVDRRLVEKEIRSRVVSPEVLSSSISPSPLNVTAMLTAAKSATMEAKPLKSRSCFAVAIVARSIWSTVVKPAINANRNSAALLPTGGVK